jgi:hypothetical protein
MDRSKSRTSSLQRDLKRLAALAYHRLENSEDLARKFPRLRRVDYADFNYIEKLYAWLFVPITLWPIDVEGLFRTAVDRIAAGNQLDETMILLIDLLPPLRRRGRGAIPRGHDPGRESSLPGRQAARARRNA